MDNFFFERRVHLCGKYVRHVQKIPESAGKMGKWENARKLVKTQYGQMKKTRFLFSSKKNPKCWSSIERVSVSGTKSNTSNLIQYKRSNTSSLHVVMGLWRGLLSTGHQSLAGFKPGATRMVYHQHGGMCGQGEERQTEPGLPTTEPRKERRPNRNLLPIQP